MSVIVGGHWTYSGNPSASNKDAVRHLIRDTNEDDQLLSDEEIEWHLTDRGGVKSAAAAACRTLSMQFAGQPKMKRVGDLQLTYGERTTLYGNLAKQLESERGIMPEAGGISIADKQETRDDTDRVQPGAYKDQFSTPGLTAGYDADYDNDVG